MKTFNTYVNEWKLTNDNNSNVGYRYKHHPLNKDELIDIIVEKIRVSPINPDLSDIDTINITDFSHLFDTIAKRFYDELIIETLDLKSWNTSNATEASNMFYEMYSLKTVKFSRLFDLSNVEDIRSMFFHCTSLEYVDVSDWNVKERTIYINHMFNGCEKLKRVDGLEKWNVSCVQYTNDMFRDCKSLQYINIDSWSDKLKRLRNDNGMFYGCSKSVVPKWWDPEL